MSTVGEERILGSLLGERPTQSVQRPVLRMGNWLCVEGLSRRLGAGAVRDPHGWFRAALAGSGPVGLAGHRGQVVWLCSHDAQPESAWASAAGWRPHHTHLTQPVAPSAGRAAASPPGRLRKRECAPSCPGGTRVFGLATAHSLIETSWVCDSGGGSVPSPSALTPEDALWSAGSKLPPLEG